MARIAVAGFQHETNTFAPAKATYQAFVEGGGWPPLLRGNELPARVHGMNLPMAGAIEVLQKRGHAVVPIVWAAAVPSSYVTQDAFERISALIVGDLAAQGPYDAVYLDLHGAMAVEQFEDGEGELLRRVRAIVGPDIPVFTSLDLHSNTTPEMVEFSNLMVAYRTYPHVDMAETGGRAAALLDRALKEKRPVHKAYRQLPFLIPLTWQCTFVEPGKSLYDFCASLEGGDVLSVSFTPGFPAADIHHCGPAVLAYGWTQEAADEAADKMANAVAEAEMAFAGKLYDPDSVVQEAARIAREASRPVVIADTQDNPGAGGNSDTTGLLAAMIRNDAQNCALGLLWDPASAKAAHAAGEGATIHLKLGAVSGVPGIEPVEGDFRVEKLGDGKFTCTGPFYGGAHMELGLMACLSIGGVRIAVSSKKCQAADQEMFRHVGIEPTKLSILGLKSSVHFRADFQPIAETILVVEAPGPMIVDPANLPFTRLRAGVRINPGGPEFKAA
ncbi:M81 family metallopeptidase [Stella sp.]|uniref:M81 family metallopeptidase n=1 Tax=Stella sp. TaxID=2912054 RepID=UPI0035B03829